MRKSLYINPCFVRTAHTTFQTHLFPNHPQINYLGRYVKHSYITDRLNSQQKKIVEKSDSFYEKFFENIILLNDEIFNQEYNEILKTAEKIYLDPNKTNIFSHDMFTLYSIHHAIAISTVPIHLKADHRTIKSSDVLKSSVSRTVSRINSLFNKINVDIYYFFNIRNQSELFPSWHIATSKELNRSGAFNMEELIQHLKDENSDKLLIKRLLNGFKFWEYFNTISKVAGKNNVKVFLYEKFREDSNNYITNFSNYLKIDSAISKKLLKNKREQVRHYDMQQSIAINSPLSLIYFKLLKNLKDPKNLFRNFKKKLINLCCLLYKNTFKFSYKDKESLKITKDNLIKQSNIIKDNLPLIKKYYKEDCLALKKELGSDIDKYNYL
ncbi:MAG: hypothetical protein H8E55_00215 [Pelagibacterales bacterium]|nr:hypothetical protein [Pelagibacterales bacterium]